MGKWMTQLSLLGNGCFTFSVIELGFDLPPLCLRNVGPLCSFFLSPGALFRPLNVERYSKDFFADWAIDCLQNPLAPGIRGIVSVCVIPLL